MATSQEPLSSLSFFAFEEKKPRNDDKLRGLSSSSAPKKKTKK
jgi:hypothetical protein